jgi:23S rRNA (cytidine1920-2'-O)/16S rRNA (cytidine1409-2'-O)-methyltransferase
VPAVRLAYVRRETFGRAGNGPLGELLGRERRFRRTVLVVTGTRASTLAHAATFPGSGAFSARRVEGRVVSKTSIRLDAAVADQAGITRSQARSLIMEGRVRVDGAVAAKAGQNVRADAAIEIEKPRRFVSRGGEKLERALLSFGIDVTGKTALDVGASTGGFTDCLLQHAAAHVTSVDVGYGQLDWRLRNDPRVSVVERTNFRLMADDAFPDGFEIIVIDASFISLRTILARAKTYLRPDGVIVALVKPQFEAGRERLGKGGVVRDPAVHRAVLLEVVAASRKLGLVATALVPSPLLGPAGNREFLLELRRDGDPLPDARIEDALVEESVKS